MASALYPVDKIVFKDHRKIFLFFLHMEFHFIRQEREKGPNDVARLAISSSWGFLLHKNIAIIHVLPIHEKGQSVITDLSIIPLSIPWESTD